MELFLDVDGVILDFESAIVDFVREEYINDLPLDYALQTWEIADEFKELDIEKVWHHFVSSDWFTKLNLLVDASSFNRIARRFSVNLITNIPETLFEARTTNLKLHGLEYDQLYMAGHFNFGDEAYPAKSEIIKKIHQPGKKIIFLDDHPKNCMDIKTNLPKSSVYLMSRPHNKGIENSIWTRVNNWNDFIEKIGC
jgi:5' nucleotidase, deoxy (Pyrimidine), cytosolic type C protein (NT5C)